MAPGGHRRLPHSRFQVRFRGFRKGFGVSCGHCGLGKERDRGASSPFNPGKASSHRPQEVEEGIQCKVYAQQFFSFVFRVLGLELLLTRLAFLGNVLKKGELPSRPVKMFWSQKYQTPH